MKEISKCYYFKNGRLDLSVLEETSRMNKENISGEKMLDQEDSNIDFPILRQANIYMDETIANIFGEMSDYFNEEEKS
ncbi:MAG: hypothetical protein RR448_11500 [Niameybacter sp.]|uniref:hypothetical protein n=1 Tax=Niameybacter sp. TaxID=2033640 RepID=UPI002FCB8FA7